MSEVSWTRERIGALLKVRYGKALPKDQRDDSAPFPVLGSAGRMTGTAEPLAFDPVVVIGRKGNVGQVQLETAGCWPIDTTYYAAIPQRLDERFLTWQLRSLELGKLDSSTATPSLRREDLEAQEVLVPSLEEQRRIVAILEDQLSRLDAADKYLADGERHIQAWRATAIDEVLWRGNPPMRPIRELLREGMRNGRSDRAVKGQERGTRTLTLTAVTQNSFTDEFTKETVTPPSVADGLWLEPGDIFVQRANTPELVGTSARYEGDRKWAIFPDLMIRLRPDETRIRGEYLVAALRSERTHRQLRAKAKGLAGSMPKIDQRAVAETCVPCPELGSQIEAVIALNEIADAASALSRDVRAQRRRSAALRRSLLAAAFSGRLTGSSTEMSVVEGRVEA